MAVDPSPRPNPIDAKNGVMRDSNTHAAQLHGHASGHDPAPLHGLDILKGKAALAVVLVRTGREISGMLFGKGDEVRSRLRYWAEEQNPS